MQPHRKYKTVKRPRKARGRRSPSPQNHNIQIGRNVDTDTKAQHSDADMADIGNGLDDETNTLKPQLNGELIKQDSENNDNNDNGTKKKNHLMITTPSMDILSESSLFIMNNANDNLLILLLSHTGLSSDICDVIISFLPLQKQLLKLHTIKYDGLYSTLQFMLTIMNNVLHYIICIFLFETLEIMIPFLILSIFESLIIAYLYLRYNSFIPGDTEIFDRIITFDSVLSAISEILVHMPMLICLFVSRDEFALWLFLTMNILVLCYRSFIYYRQLRANSFLTTKYVINPMFYLLTTALMMIIDGIYIQRAFIVITGAIIYYPGIPILCHISKSNRFWRTDVLSVSNFIFICFENIAFGIFGEELLFNDYDIYLTKLIIIFAVIGAGVILVVHTQFDNLYFLYLKITKNVDEKSWEEKQKKMKLEKKRYDDDEDEEQLLRELSKIFIDFFMDILVSFPMFILFLYYMYYNDDGTKYAISFDIAFVLYFFHGVFRFFSSICYDMDLNTFTHDWISQLFFMSLITKISMIACVFGAVYLVGYVSNDIERSIFLLIVSIIFSCFGCISWCLICYVCTGCICGGGKSKKRSRSNKSPSSGSKHNNYDNNSDNSEERVDDIGYDENHHHAYIENSELIESP